MNTEAIIETLLLSQDEQILNTPLEDLDLSNRVYKSLWRSRVRTIGDVAHAWNCFPKVRNIGERARCEILGALQAWSRSLPNFTNPDDADRQAQAQVDLRSPIEVLHLSTRIYYALKRNRIESLGDIYREWDKIASLRNVGPRTLNEIQRALAAAHPPENVRSFADPNPESHLATDDSADRSAADALGYENSHEVPTKKYIITDSCVVVNAELLEAEESRKPRAERWKNVSTEQVSAKAQDYAPKNIFQSIGEGQNKISSPIQRRKKPLDGSVPISSEWFELSLYFLEKARTSRQLRTINCPICMARTLSLRFKKHLVNEHPQAFRELKKAGNRSPGIQNEKSVGIVHTPPLQETHPVKCPLCEHTVTYNALQTHIRDFHPEIDPGLVMTRFNKVHRSKDDQNLSKYRDELNELIREYGWLKRAQAEPRDGNT
jgi:hypothetical protein